jgi:hypothetical protein
MCHRMKVTPDADTKPAGLCAPWKRFAARASGLALAVRPAGAAEAPVLKGGRLRPSL